MYVRWSRVIVTVLNAMRGNGLNKSYILQSIFLTTLFVLFSQDPPLGVETHELSDVILYGWKEFSDNDVRSWWRDLGEWVCFLALPATRACALISVGLLRTITLAFTEISRSLCEKAGMQRILDCRCVEWLHEALRYCCQKATQTNLIKIHTMS